jgi:hypothetical protein
LSENTTSSAVISPKSRWNLTPLRSLKVQTRPSSLLVQLSARSGSSFDRSAEPGGKRTRPLKAQPVIGLSCVVVALWGSTWPMSGAAMPMVRVFCASAGEAMARASAATEAVNQLFMSYSLCGARLCVRKRHAACAAD